MQRIILCLLFLCLPLCVKAASFSKEGEKARQYAEALFYNASSPIAGNPKGQVILVEFLDYQCPYCVVMSSDIDALIQHNPNLRVVYKELAVHGDVSDFAAKAVLAANRQGKFLALHRALMKTKQRPLSVEGILAMAKANGLDVNRLQADIESPEVQNIMRDDLALADNLGVEGTPTFYIAKTSGKNGKSIGPILYVYGARSEEALQEMIRLK